MVENQAPSTDSWDGFVETYLKAEHVKTWPGKVFVAFVNSGLSPKDKPQIICDVQYDGKKYKWDCNKTNMKKLITLGIKTPKDLQNKFIIFNKIRVQNPSTKQPVDSLEVENIE